MSNKAAPATVKKPVHNGESTMTADAIRALLERGKQFHVATDGDRRAVLSAKRFLGIAVSTRRDKLNGGFTVFFLNGKS